MSAFSRAARRSDPRLADVLPPNRPQPVRSTPFPSRPAEIVDAEFEVLQPGRMPAARVVNDNRRPAQANPATPARPGILTVLNSPLRRLSRPAFAVLTAGLFACTFLLSAMLSPPSAPGALEITDVSTALGDADGLRILQIYGAVTNRTATRQAIPPILVDLPALGHPASGQDHLEAHLAGTGPLAPGETRRFSARLPHSGGTLPRPQISFALPGASPR